MKTALIIGATGLVGRKLLEKVLTDARFSTVKIFVRKSCGLLHAKLVEYVINFDEPEKWSHLVTGDVLFSALGTTLSAAGSKERQYAIDYGYQFSFASAAAANNVPDYVLVSSAGAKENANGFYLKMKGELERDIKKLGFVSVYFIKPSLLVGDRKEERTGEKIGFVLLNAVNSIGLFRKYKPVPAEVVAQAMVNCAISRQPGTHVVELKDVFKVARHE
jgi:uncharacterized protein YbjT (DUF2867 family)